MPSTLLEPCEQPERIELKTNADIVRLLSNIIQAYELCSSKHDALVKAIEHKGE